MQNKKQIPLESKIVKSIMDYLKKVPGCFAWKEHGGMYGVAGIPDIICCYKGKFLAFEVKRPDVGRITRLQTMTIGKINAAGGKATVVYSVDDVKNILKNGKGHPVWEDKGGWT